MHPHHCILAGKVSVAVREGRDLCWADEGKVQRVEEQHNVLALHRYSHNQYKQFADSAML